MTLKFGQITTIVISSSTFAKEILQKQDLAFSSYRVVGDALHAMDHHKYALGLIPIGPKWQAIRKALSSKLSSNINLRASKNLRSKKVKEFMEHCSRNSEKGEAVNIGLGAFTTTLNLMSNTVFSEDVVKWNSEYSQEFNVWVRDLMHISGVPNLVDFFPVLKMFDPQGIRRRMESPAAKILGFAERVIDERLKQRGKGMVKDDMLDVLLSSMDENPDHMDKKTIMHAIMDIFVAGTDTSSNTIEFAMAEVMKNPNIMRKAKEELTKIIGKEKTIEEDDVNNLPYLQCIVKETFRLHPIVPFLLPRKVGQDNVQVNGFTIPKGAQVLVNAWAIGRDPSLWESPLEFKPERFWNSKIDVRGQHFELIPFGGGRRICPGLPLAIKMIPFMLASLLNSFDWKLEGDVAPETLNMDERFGMALQKAQPLLLVPVPC